MSGRLTEAITEYRIQLRRKKSFFEHHQLSHLSHKLTSGSHLTTTLVLDPQSISYGLRSRRRRCFEGLFHFRTESS